MVCGADKQAKAAAQCTQEKEAQGRKSRVKVEVCRAKPGLGKACLASCDNSFDCHSPVASDWILRHSARVLASISRYAPVDGQRQSGGTCGELPGVPDLVLAIVVTLNRVS